jgi:hypothetical protein
LSALARSLFLSRRRWQEKYLAARQRQRELRETLARCEARCQQVERQRQELADQVARLQTRLDQPRPISLPLGDAPPGHQYGANLMALSANLGRELGIRPARRAMKIFLGG